MNDRQIHAGIKGSLDSEEATIQQNGYNSLDHIGKNYKMKFGGQ